MTDKNDPNKKHYFQPISADEFAEKLLSLCSKEIPMVLTIWEKGETEDQSEIYHAVAYDPALKLIKLLPTGKLVTKIMGSQKAGKNVLVKFPINDKVNYFSGGMLTFHQDDLTYSIEIQQDIFKSQQRGNYRLNTSELIPVQFKIDDQVFDALDISTGGTSFLIADFESERFAKGKVFLDCTLRLDRKNYYIPKAQVAIQIPQTTEAGTPNGKIKIGISFKDLARKTEDELYIKISTEARGDEMKKKFDSILSKKPNPT